MRSPLPYHLRGCALKWWNLLFWLGLARGAVAQQRPPDLLIGLKFGLNLSTFVGESCVGAPFRWNAGLAAGGLVARPLSAHSAVQVEVLVSQKGIRQTRYAHVYQDPTFISTANTYQAVLQYLDLPLLYTIGPGSAGRAGLFVAAGPQLSLALTRREFVHPTDDGPGGPHEETLATDYRALVPVGAGYVVGAGYRWATGPAAGACLELRYSGDITRVYQADYGAGTLCPGGSNQFGNGVVQVQMSWLFGKRAKPDGLPLPAPTPPPAEPVPPVWPPRPIIIPMPLPRPLPPPPREDPRTRPSRRMPERRSQPFPRGEHPPVPPPSVPY